jgi:two-component system sensor histidine kinase ChiS
MDMLIKFLKKYAVMIWITVLIIIGTLLLIPALQPVKQKTFAIKKGILSLKNWNFHQKGAIALKGEWEFYWNQLLYPADFQQKKSISNKKWISVPQPWNGYNYNGKLLSEDGFATYKAKVILPYAMKEHLALRIRRMGTAYRIFINGDEIAHSGKVGTKKELMVPFYLPQTAIFTSKTRALEIIIHVSNFHFRDGGIWENIDLGFESNIRKITTTQSFLEIFLVGSALMMAFYHLGLFGLRKHDRSPFYFGIFCLLVVLRILVAGEGTFARVFPLANWETLLFFDYLSIYLTPVFLCTFIHSIFPKEFSSKFLIVVNALGILGVVILIIFPAKIYSKTLLFYEVLILVACFFILYSLALATIRKKGGASVFLLGFIVFFFTVTHDILADIFRHPQRYLGIGLFVFIFSQAFSLSNLFLTSFLRVESLSKKLRTQSRELKEKNNRLLEYDEQKDEFLANTSHELKTPLQGMIGLADSVIDGAAGQVNDSVKNNLSMIVDTGRRLNQLINDILDVSALKHREIQLEQKTISLRTLVKVVLILLKPLSSDKRLILINRVPRKLDYIYADENRLHQIMDNLIGNAIKYSDSGTITISAEKKDEMIEVSIADTGIGFTQEKVSKLFAAFERDEIVASQDYEGYGLGLGITKKLIELHGGTIRIVPNQGKGTQVVFTLPISQSKKKEKLEKGPLFFEKKIPDYIQKDSFLEVPSYNDVKILVVDDEAINRRLLKNHLTLQEYHVTLAESGEKALELINKMDKEDLPDLILLDVMMFKLSGFDVCKKIRETYSSSEIPIIFLSARNQIKDLIQGLKAGANDYIVKPFSKEELLARVSLQVKISKLNRERKKLISSLEEKVKIRTQELEKSLNSLKLLQSQLVHTERMSSLGTLSAGIAHEINNPVAFTHVAAQNLERDLTAFQEFIFDIAGDDAGSEMVGIFHEKFDRFFSEIKSLLEGTRRIKSIVSDLRTFSRVDIIEQNYSNLFKGLRSTIKIVQTNYKNKIDFQVNIFSDLEVFCNISQINQVFMNILINACQSVESCEKKTPFVKIDSYLLEDSNKVGVSIQDNGEGIDEDKIDQIFEPFYTTKPVNQGTGLGLSISHGIIENHHGKIDVQSKKGKGTTMTIVLPIRQKARTHEEE